jgi:hypothetical protein
MFSELAVRRNIVNRMLRSSVLVDCTAYLASIQDAQAVRKAIIEARSTRSMWAKDGDIVLACFGDIYGKEIVGESC